MNFFYLKLYFTEIEEKVHLLIVVTEIIKSNFITRQSIILLEIFPFIIWRQFVRSYIMQVYQYIVDKSLRSFLSRKAIEARYIS